MISVYAHRGSTGPARENTVAAFIDAVRRAADGVEFDVRRCADGALVVHHDSVIPGAGAIDSLRSSDLPEWVPLLADALAACAEVFVNVEVKSETAGPSYDPLERCAISAARLCAGGGPGIAPAKIVLSCFSLPALLAAQQEAPELEFGWVWGPAAAFDVRRRLETACTHGFQAIHPFHPLVNAELVRDAHEAGLAVRAWTVDDAARIADLASAGADAVITNDVPAALRALGRS